MVRGGAVYAGQGDRPISDTRTMRRLLLGLVRRTRSRIYLAMSDYSESGFEQTGPLMGLVNRLLAQRSSEI